MQNMFGERKKRTATHLESFDPLGSLDIMLVDVKLQSCIDIASAPDGSVLLCRWTRKRNGQIDRLAKQLDMNSTSLWLHVLLSLG